MIPKENKLYLLLFIFNVISHCDGLVEFRKTDLTKILQSIDAASSDTHLFDVTLKLLQSVCACMHVTLHKDHKIFIDEANSLHLEEETGHEKDIKLYKQIYNSTCIHLRHELVNKFRRHELSDDDDDTNQEGNYALTKYQNHYIEENMKAVMKRTLFASLIKKRDNRIYKIEKHNLFSNKLLLGDNHKNRVIIIITLYPFLNKTVEKMKIREVTEKEIKETLSKDTPIDIDIINTADTPDYKNNFRAVIAKKCDLYSIYLFILQSLKKNTIKTFKFLRRKGTIKIYIDASANQNVENFHNLCCENNISLTECRKLIFEDIAENFVQNKTDKNKLETYKDIVLKIKLLVKQFGNKTSNNQRLIRSSKLLLVTNPITDYGYKADNKSQKILATTPPGYRITITSNYNNLQLLNSTELITSTNIMKKQSDEYILSNKSGSLSNISNINNSNTTTNETSNRITTVISGVRLEHLLTNDDNMKYRNLISNNELIKKQTMDSPDEKTKLIPPNRHLTQTLDYPLTSMTFYKQRHIPKDIAISTPPYMAETSGLKIFFSQVKENGTSTKPVNNCIGKSSTKDKSNSSFVFTNDSYNNQHFFEILQNTIKNLQNTKSTKFNSKETQAILPQNNTSQSNIFDNFGLSTKNPRSVLRFKDNNINLFKSSLYDYYAKTSTETIKINILLKDKSTPLEKPHIQTQSYTLNETNYLQEKQNKSQNILENLKQKKVLSTSLENIGAFDSNAKTYVSNANKKVSVILSKVETKPDKHANVAHIQRENEHVISDQSKRYDQTSPLHFIIDQGKQRSSQNDNVTSTATNVSNELNNATVQRYDSNFIKTMTLPVTLPFHAVKNLETTLSPPITLKNKKVYRQTTLPQLKTLSLKAISEEQQNIKQKDLNNLPLYKNNPVNDYDNFITESRNKAYYTSNRTFKIEVISGKDYSVKGFKRKSDFFTHLSNNNEASSENATLTKDINTHSNDLNTLSPNKLDADLTKDIIQKNTQMNLVPDLTTLLGSNIYNKVITPHSNASKNFTHETSTLHYLIPKQYVRNKNKTLQNFETSMSSKNEITYFNKYHEKKLQRPPLFKEKISGGPKKIKLDSANSTKPGNVIDSQKFQVTESINEITVARTYSKGFINKEDGNLVLPSLILTKLKPLSASKIKNIHHLSILNGEDIPKLKENDTLSWKNEVILEQSSTGYPENTINIFLQSDPHASEDRSKAFNYFKHKNIGKLLSKHISVNYDFSKDVLNVSNTKVPVYTTDIFSIKRSQNKQRRQYNKYENKEIDGNKNTFSLNESNHKNESKLTNSTIPLTTTKVSKLITNNKIAVTQNTIPKPQTLLKINLSPNTFENNNKMSTINKVTYAPNIGKTKLFDSITSSILYLSHVAKLPTQYPQFNTSKSTTNITIKNISYKEIDEGVKRVTSTKRKEENKKSTLLPTLFNKLGMTNSLDNNIVILSTENTNVLTYFDATKRLIFANNKLLSEEKHFKPKTLTIKSSEPDVTPNNIYDHLQFNKQNQYVSKKKNLTEKKEMSQTEKNMTYLLWPIKYYNQNLTKNDSNLTTSSKKFKKSSTKTGFKEDMYNTSSINPQMNIVLIETESTKNFTKQTQINTLETLSLRYNNGNLNAANNVGINLNKINENPEKRVIDQSFKTYNKTTILHLSHKDLTLMHHTRSYTSDFKNSETNQNVATIRTVNSITANKQKYEDALFKKGQNLKLYKEKEKSKTPYLEMSTFLLLLSQTTSPQIKDSTVKRITDYKSIPSTENYQTLKSISKTRKMTTSLPILLNKYQNYKIKNRLKVSKSSALNKTLKSENLKVYITTPVYATNLMQNKTNFIPETYLNNDLKRIIVTPEIYTKSGQNQKYKSGRVIKKNNTVYHTNETGVTEILNTVIQLEIQNVKSTIPVLLKTDTNITYLYLGNYSQYGSNGPNMKIMRMPKDLTIKDNEKSGTLYTLYNGTDIPDIELTLHTYNRNISIVSKVLSKSIGSDTENEITKQEMQNVLKVKQQHQNKKTFIHTEYVPLISSTTESYSSKDFNINRQFHINNNLMTSEYPSQQYVTKKLHKTDLRYNNIASKVFPETKDKNKNQINDTILPNLNNGSNTNYDLVSFPQRKYTSDVKDINHSAVLKSTSEKKLHDENIMNEYMKKRFALDEMPWDVNINKSIGINHPQIPASNRKKIKRVEFFKSKSTTTTADTSLNKLEVNNIIKYTTSEMSHLNNTQLDSRFLNFVPYLNSYTSKYFPSSLNAIENQIRATLPIDHKYNMTGQIYYTTISPLTKIITRFDVPKINTTITPTFEDKGYTNGSLFVILYDNTTSITRNLYKNEPPYTTNGVLDKKKRSFFSKDRTTSILGLDAGKLQQQHLNKKMFLPNKRNKMVLDPMNIKVTNKTAFHSNILKNINYFYNRNGSRDSDNIKIQINNNFKIKALTYQKVYIKNDYKLRTTTKRFKKSKTIKYNTYQPTDRNLDITQSMPENINFNERDKQTTKPKDSLYTRISIIPTKSILGSKLKLSKITVTTNRSNGQQPKSKVSNKELANVNKNSLLYPFDKTNLYPVKKLSTNIQRKILRRIHFPNKDRQIIAINTKDFFQRPAIPNNNYFRKPFIPYLRNQIEKPVTFKPKQYIISPMFDKMYDSNLKYKHVRPKPLLIDNNDFYREELQTNHRSNALLLRQKVNFIRHALPPSIGNSKVSKVSHVIERPVYLPPNTKPRFLRDRIDSIRNYMNNADFIKSTELSIKHYVEDATEVAGVPYEDPLYFFRKSGWYDTKISDDSITSTMAPIRTGRKRKTIFYLSPTVTDWWLDDMYLKIRLPVPINSNPGMVFPRKQFAKIDEVADLAALYIDDLLDYKEMLDRGELPQERATSREKGQPLCMEQFYRLLGVCRIPEVGKDRLELPSRPSDPYECEELIIVACRNYFYPIPVKASDRGRLNPGEIQAQLLHAMVDAAGAPPAPKIGLLTSMNRDQWAKAREQLIKDDTNRCNFDLISRALCVLCVDEAGGDRPGVDPDTNALLRAMHGAGTAYHSANRWFDKTVQLIISSDGTVGMCYEHSPAEGVAVVRLAERALARADVAPRPAPPPALLPAPAALRWTLTGDTPRTIERAGRELDRAISDLDLKVYTYRGYGREFMKTCRTSPDVYIQLALQYAYYKMYGYLVSTYESASLRRFHNGRVDNIRSAHSAAQAWASAMTAADAPHDEEGGRKVSFNLYGEQKRLELFEEAARKQTSIMEANIQGRGMDNHLLGLREAAREALGSLPDLFTDQTYTRMIEFRLSTSQVATTTEGTFMGYGAVVPDGYGCSYNPKRDCVIFCISSFVSSSVTNTEAFRQALEEALDSMKLMFQNKKVEG